MSTHQSALSGESDRPSQVSLTKPTQPRKSNLRDTGPATRSQCVHQTDNTTPHISTQAHPTKPPYSSPLPTTSAAALAVSVARALAVGVVAAAAAAAAKERAVSRAASTAESPWM